MTDREMLELAAKAYVSEDWLGNPHYMQGFMSRWNPLTDDGDALRLAVKLGLVVDCSRPSAGEPYKRHAIWLDELISNAELTRRAIVMAAAALAVAKVESANV